MIFSSANLNCLEFVVAADAGDIGPQFVLELLAQAFLRSLVLKMMWIRTLEYVCDRGRPSGTYSQPGCLPSADALG